MANNGAPSTGERQVEVRSSWAGLTDSTSELSLLTPLTLAHGAVK
jgi:hypothetical protein